MQDDFQTGPEPDPVALPLAQHPFSTNPAELRSRIKSQGLPMLYAMRDIMRQVPIDLSRFVPAGATELPGMRQLQNDAQEAFEFLENLPEVFDLADGLDTRPLAMRDGGADTQEDPRLGKLISIWTAWFGAFTPTGRDMGKPVAVPVPIFDYVVEPMVEKSLTVEVDASQETSGKTSFKLKVRGVGLSGSTQFKITDSLDGEARDHSFQVVVPVYLELTEYQGPMQSIYAYTARAIDADPPRTQRPPDTPAGDASYVKVEPPKNPVPLEAEFLNNDALAEPTTRKIEKGDGLSLSIPFNIEDWLELSLDCEAKAQMDIAMTFTKTRADKLMKRQYRGMKAKWEVYPAS
ncbi:hypothetical protein [Thalassococcus lentus]|uniref:Uncharacterized protein n=1 Tax=Thalassococcus lentus TaxID=1210524 RepID=A0ABT4XPC0_9RHOB|nr:hypothetical protein [Thalassococcus lentus]MDA7423718.1 hypothetical protein [Thalassococcus lentus]